MWRIVLAAVSVPTYKRMVAKARTGEAKIALGGLYKAFAGFYAEYGTYHPHLFLASFEMQGERVQGTLRFHNGRYSVGFAGGSNCHTAFTPSIGDMFFYLGWLNNTFGLTRSVQILGNYVSNYNSEHTTAASWCLGGNSTPTTYRAAASAVIQNGVDRDTETISEIDQWTIDIRPRFPSSSFDQRESELEHQRKHES